MPLSVFSDIWKIQKNWNFVTKATDANDKCIGFSGSNFAGDKADRKSTSVYRFKLSDGVVSYRSSKQTGVALSTFEAEYVALSSAAQEAVWIIKLLKDLNYKKYWTTHYLWR